VDIVIYHQTKHMDTSINVQENLQPNPTAINPNVEAAVLGNLRLLIPAGYYTTQARMNLLNFAVGQLCKAKVVAEIDWVSLVHLTADISILSSSGVLRKAQE
jgi:hypothetical protein